MKQGLSILLICIFFFQSLSAQETGYLNGTIVDSLSNVNIIAANVYVPDDTIQYGVVSDLNGFYVLELPVGRHQILVSYIGYEDKIIDVEIVANKTLTQNIFIHVPILRRPEAGEAIDGLYGHWKIKCIERDGKTLRPSRADKKNGLAGLYYLPFEDHEDGIGVFRYSNGGPMIGDFYFRHEGEGFIRMDHVFIQEITISNFRTRSFIYNNLNFGKIWDDYKVSFKNADKMIIENDRIKMICIRVESD